MGSKQQEFSNRWGIILASLGMAIGAGNLWRFPRLAGQYGGSFIILWIFFLMVWSIPILLAEFSIGKKYKCGVIGSFGQLNGKGYTWMGFFITLCTLGIAFYYSVVTAWALEYLGVSIVNLYNHLFDDFDLNLQLRQDADFLNDQWSDLANGNIYTVIVYLVVVLLGVYFISRNIRNGLEKANKCLIPSLFVLLVMVAVVSLNMDGGVRGLAYMFHTELTGFGDSRVWIEAITQSAWSTGAGWGLLMTISSYSRSGEDVTLNTFVGAFGNNTASLLAGMAILPAVFALSPGEKEAVAYLQSGSQALTFTIIPKLFANVSGGYFLTVLFFLALTIAAFSSFLPMLQLFKSNVARLGWSDKVGHAIMVGIFMVCGFPSAWSLDFFSNQDWVWGVGLIVSGVFICVGTIKHGAIKFKHSFIDRDSDFRVADRYFAFCILLNVLLGVFLIFWWMSQGYSSDPWFKDGRWNVLDVYSNATIVTQWGAVILLGILLNRWLYKKFCDGANDVD